jgi:exodeoxyribonuclease-3
MKKTPFIGICSLGFSSFMPLTFNFITFGIKKLYKNISYNVNGIRAAISKFISWLQQANPDVICLQEIKATEQIPLLDFELAGYPYHYWFRLQKKDTVEQLFCLKLNPIKLFTGQG